ncbi:MAG: hypothetical protein EUB_01989 [Eubacterium sp.]|uniref:hypothetical protein n=1 Tax=Eubacterium sp. TaxID=142586 RepID=UPI003051EA4B
MSSETLTAIQGIFTGAASDISGMMVPVLTAGVVIAIGILAFGIGKKLLKKSVS